MRQIEDALRSRFNTNVALSEGKDKGRIVIEYYSEEDLTRLLEQFGVKYY